MVTGDYKTQVDSLWQAFWSGGVSNPLSVIEQITYLLFIRRLDALQTKEDSKAALGIAASRTIFPAGNYVEDVPDPDDPQQRITVPYQDLRWSFLRNMAPEQAFKIMDNFVFPFLQKMGGEGSSHNTHMKDARFGIPTPQLLAKAMDIIDSLPLDSRQDRKGDIYEYMLGKIASAGQNGQFRTPRHIIELMVALTAPKPTDTIVDPASGTCGFLVAASEYVSNHHPDLMLDDDLRKHFQTDMFNGFDFDTTMLRIGSMNMMLHGVEDANIAYRDSLAEETERDEGCYSLVLANPPFAGSLDYESTAKDLQRVVKTKKTELLFLALFLRLMKIGGRAAVIVPDGVMFGSSKAHKSLRQLIVERHKLDAVIKMPSGVFKPYAGVSTAILLFTKTDTQDGEPCATDTVWFYDMQADGYSLDDKRTPLLDEEQLGVWPEHTLDTEDHAKNNLPDILTRWAERGGAEMERARTEQSFTVTRDDIAKADYDLSLNRYKEIVYEAVDYPAPKEIIAELREIEAEIAKGLDALEGMLG